MASFENVSIIHEFFKVIAKVENVNVRQSVYGNHITSVSNKTRVCAIY